MASFAIRYTGLNSLMRFMGLGPRASGMDVTDTDLQVRMGWAFRLRTDRSNIADVALDPSRVGGWGVHGWRGVWLVNGSSKGIVRIDLREPTRARVIGFPIKVRAVRVSAEAPEALVAALQ